MIRLRFDKRYTHLDTIFGALSRGVVIVFEPASEVESLANIREAYPELVSLINQEQTSAGANVMPQDP